MTSRTDVDVDQLVHEDMPKDPKDMPMACLWHDSGMTVAERSEVRRSKDLRTEDLIISVSVSQYRNIEVRYLTISASQYRYILISGNITSISARYQSRIRSSLDQVTISLITVETTREDRYKKNEYPAREKTPRTPLVEYQRVEPEKTRKDRVGR
jgi:hypothetical protein